MDRKVGLRLCRRLVFFAIGEGVCGVKDPPRDLIFAAPDESPGRFGGVFSSSREEWVDVWPSLQGTSDQEAFLLLADELLISSSMPNGFPVGSSLHRLVLPTPLGVVCSSSSPSMWLPSLGDPTGVRQLRSLAGRATPWNPAPLSRRRRCWRVRPWYFSCCAGSDLARTLAVVDADSEVDEGKTEEGGGDSPKHSGARDILGQTC